MKARKPCLTVEPCRTNYSFSTELRPAGNRDKPAIRKYWKGGWPSSLLYRPKCSAFRNPAVGSEPAPTELLKLKVRSHLIHERNRPTRCQGEQSPSAAGGRPPVGALWRRATDQ